MTIRQNKPKTEEVEEVEEVVVCNDIHKGSKFVRKFALEILRGRFYEQFDRYYDTEELAFEALTKMGKCDEIWRIHPIYIKTFNKKEEW